MKNKDTGNLKLKTLGLVAFHFLTVVLHSVAHEVLSVKATAAQLAFIIPVIILAPVVGGLLILKFEKAGALLLSASMAGSFFFGLYYHFVARTVDHVGHVANLEPSGWSAVFIATAYLLALSESLGAVAGYLLLTGRGLPEDYTARTDF